MAAIDTPTAPPAPTPNATAVVPDVDVVVHAYCAPCWSSGAEPIVAACGHRPAERPGRVADPSDLRCIVCVDLMWKPCPRCGR